MASGLDRRLVKTVESVVKGESKRIKALGSLINVNNMEFLISSLSQSCACKRTTKSLLVEEVWLTCSELPQDFEKKRAALDLLSQFLRQHKTSIRTILFSRNEFGNEQIGRLLPVFYQNQALLELNLSTNKLQGAAGGAAIRTLLEHNDHLKKLILWNNPFGVEGANALASGLIVNNSLEHLDLGICKLGDEGVAILVDALTAEEGVRDEQGSRRSGIKSLDLHANDLTGRVLVSLTTLLSSPSSPRIKSLDVWHTPDLLKDSGKVRPFAHALSHHKFLQRLNLRECGMNDEAALWLFPALEANSTLDFVNLFCDREQLGPIGCQRLVRSLPKLKPRYFMCHAPFWSKAEELLTALDQNIHLEVVNGIHMLGKDKQNKLKFVLDRNKVLARASSLVNAPTETIPVGLWPLALGTISQVNKRPDGVASSAIFELLHKSVVQWI